MVSDGLSIDQRRLLAAPPSRMSRVVARRALLRRQRRHLPGRRHAVGDNCLSPPRSMVPDRRADPRRRRPARLAVASRSRGRSRATAGFEAPAPATRCAARLARKNRYNLRTMALVPVRALDLGRCRHRSCSPPRSTCTPSWSVLVIAAAMVVMLVFQLVLQRAGRAAGRRVPAAAPQCCSIYDPYYWWHERLWKLEAPVAVRGTPFKPDHLAAAGRTHRQAGLRRRRVHVRADHDHHRRRLPASTPAW